MIFQEHIQITTSASLHQLFSSGSRHSQLGNILGILGIEFQWKTIPAACNACFLGTDKATTSSSLPMVDALPVTSSALRIGF
jgi:hypothetical protein